MNNKKYLYNGSFEGMEGIILESRGGAKGSKNERNSNYKELLVSVLDLFKKNQQENIQIFIASNNKKYKSLNDRLIIIDGESVFDFSKIDIDSFLPKLNKAIISSGQDEDVKGGNSTKRLFFLTNDFYTPFVLEDNDNSFISKESILNILENFQFNFDKTKTLSNELKKELVLELQKSLKSYLEIHLRDYKWQMEYNPSTQNKDSFDIYGQNEKTNHSIVIELDPHRADSLAKKFVSRMALMADKNITYIAFIYPGTDRMSISEANKYLTYCETLTNILNKDNCKKEFMGYYL